MRTKAVISAVCDGCGGVATKKIHLTNGVLRLCSQCLEDINRKNPEVKSLKDELRRTRESSSCEE